MEVLPESPSSMSRFRLGPSCSGPSDVARLPSTNAGPAHYDAVVIGAGPGGLTAISNLLDQGLSRICMIDPSFTAGRIHERYREVPSNTKVKMFVQWATGTKAFSGIIESTPKPNPYTKMLGFDQEKGCILADAIDVAQILSDGLRKDPRVTSVKAFVKCLKRFDDKWHLKPLDEKMTSDRVVVAQGAEPKPSPRDYSPLKELQLDTCLKPSELKTVLPPGSVVAVVGSSHSAVLAMKNLYELEGVKVVNFYRSPLLYAIYEEGWILYDNTGLKGVAADWAKDVLEKSDNEVVGRKLRRVSLRSPERQTDPATDSSFSSHGEVADDLKQYEDKVYTKELKDCTHVVSAVGYENHSLPKIIVDGEMVRPVFDPLAGTFTYSGSNTLKGLFGTGIAWPERVTDPLGNVESAVGWFKFMKFVKRVAPSWASIMSCKSGDNKVLTSDSYGME